MKWALRGLSLLALGIVIYLFWPLLGEIRDAAVLFRTADWGWFLAALAIQIVSYSCLTWLNAISLQPFPGKIRFSTLAGILTSIAFIETAFPTAGVSGVALRAHLLGKRGSYSVEVSIFTLAMETVFMSLAVASVGVLGLAHLFQGGDLSNLQFGQVVTASVVVVGLTWAGWRTVQDQRSLTAITTWAGGVWNRLVRGKDALHLKPVDSEQLVRRLETFHQSLVQFRKTPLWKFLLAAFSRILLDIATLAACFKMFHHPIPAGTLVTGYGIILTLSGLSSLPGGLGVTELSIPVIFSRLGQPGAVAIAAGLTYRLIGYWLVRFIGFVNWQLLEAGKE